VAGCRRAPWRTGRRAGGDGAVGRRRLAAARAAAVVAAGGAGRDCLACGPARRCHCSSWSRRGRGRASSE
jgi:hypothetical protein